MLSFEVISYKEDTRRQGLHIVDRLNLLKVGVMQGSGLKGVIWGII